MQLNPELTHNRSISPHFSESPQSGPRETAEPTYFPHASALHLLSGSTPPTPGSIDPAALHLWKAFDPNPRAESIGIHRSTSSICANSTQAPRYSRLRCRSSLHSACQS
ncbi:unnamed protein product [Pleuronectes platessa]|uniref:Uncharacterized protein n=1 Tax=Pleuronectes platessa TaxID=8262 RepID=A0A9N7Z0B5_PLEPL|nr:unnamed protein product [Pleuronectes platessa]